MEPIKIVLDTSAIVAALFNGRSVKLLSYWRKGQLILCFCPAIYNEYEHILTRIPPIHRKADRLLTELSQSESVLYTTKIPRIRLAIDDPSDRKFVACAIGTDADCIVSLDDHLLGLKVYHHIPIVSPRDFFLV